MWRIFQLELKLILHIYKLVYLRVSTHFFINLGLEFGFQTIKRSQNPSVNVADRKVASKVLETCRKRFAVESVLLAPTVGLL